MNFKIYRNVKAALGTRDWWKGVFGNILSTIIGILLTIGIGAIVQYHNEKKLAREAMFSIIKICDDNREILEAYDSTFQGQIEYTGKIFEMYYATNKFADLKTQKQADSIVNWMKMMQPTIENRDAHADRYFNSAQMMHQIGNAAVYSQFARFVEMDRETFDKLDDLNRQMVGVVKAIEIKSQFDRLENAQPLVAIIEDKTLPDYFTNVRLSNLPTFILAYKMMHKRLLKAMDATEEEYQDYVKDNTTDLKNVTITTQDAEKQKTKKPHK